MNSFFGTDLVMFVKAAGYLGLFGIIFAESGLFLGFFLPGDSLLFTAGFLAAQGYFNITILIAVFFLGAVLGDNFGYAFGRRAGPVIFKQEDSLIFHKNHLERARLFYEKYGGKTIILARFIPIVRTFAPILAGAGRMHYSTFLIYNVSGGLLWTVGLPVLGYFLGSIIPDANRYIVPLVIVIIILSFLPPIVEILKDSQHREEIKQFFKSRLGIK